MLPVTPHVFRLTPGQDLKKALQDFVDTNRISAGWVNSCVGSLTQYAIRFANQPRPATGAGHFEILSLSGTVSNNGSHLHICIADENGRAIGGHLTEGCLVYTTVEIVISATDELSFTREADPQTGFNELKVSTR